MPIAFAPPTPSETPPLPELASPDPPSTKRPRADRGSRLAGDWALPKGWGDWALAEFPLWTPEKVRREADNFADHWHAKTGKDATSRDWHASWRKWCRNPLAHHDDPKRVNGRPHAQGPPPQDTEARNAEAARLLGFRNPNEPDEVIDA